jgi:hypothetical protein
MPEQDEDKVVCVFCGESLPAANALEMRLMFGSEETQTIYAHPAHLRQHLHPSVPLHPDLWETAEHNTGN